MNKIFVFLFLICLSCNLCFARIMQDEFVNETLKDVPAPQLNTKYDYTSLVKLPVKMNISERIKSEKDIYEGQEIEFVVRSHVSYKNRIYIKKGTIIKADVSVIITPGMNGIPASIIFDNFRADGVASENLSPSYEIFGFDRSWLVFPLKWALTILPPTGSLTNFIMGGHAKLKPNKTITIYYYPDWK